MPNLNTTRCSDLVVGHDGAVGVSCVWRRSITTHGAHQEMPSPVGTTASFAGSWNYFVRVYVPDLSSVRYSSLVTGQWNQSTGAGGSNTLVAGIALDATRLWIAGELDACTSVGGSCDANLVSAHAAKPNPVPPTLAPAWAAAVPVHRSAVLGAFDLTWTATRAVRFIAGARAGSKAATRRRCRSSAGRSGSSRAECRDREAGR